MYIEAVPHIFQLKKHKLIHSGKKIEFMKSEIKKFIEFFKDDQNIIEQLSSLKQISNINVKTIKEVIS